MNRLFHIYARKLIYSAYMPEHCLTIILRIIEESLCGKYLISYDGVLTELENTREIGLYYNAFVPTANIYIRQTDNGSEVNLFFEVNTISKRFSKFLYLFMIAFELIFVLCEVLSNAISNVLLLFLPLEMLLTCHVIMNICFILTVKRYIKMFDNALGNKD